MLLAKTDQASQILSPAMHSYKLQIWDVVRDFRLNKV